MSQQQRANGYQASGTSPTFEIAWETLRVAAQSVTDAYTPGGGGSMALDPGFDPFGRGTIFE